MLFLKTTKSLACFIFYDFNSAVELLESTKGVYNSDKFWTKFSSSFNAGILTENKRSNPEKLIIYYLTLKHKLYTKNP